MWQLQQLQSLQLPAATPPQSQPPPPSQEPANSSTISSPSPPPAPAEPAPSEPVSTSADKLTLELAFTPQTAPVSTSPLSLPANDVDKETLDAAFTPQQPAGDPKIISLASPLSLPGDDLSDQPAADTAFIPQQPTVPEEPRPSTPNPLTDELLLPADLSSTPTQDTTVDKQLLDAAFTPN